MFLLSAFPVSFPGLVIVLLPIVVPLQRKTLLTFCTCLTLDFKNLLLECEFYNMSLFKSMLVRHSR